MTTDFGFLDYAWRGLIVTVFTSTLIFAAMALGARLFSRRLSQQQMKWHFHLQFALLALILTGEFLFVAFADPELASGCFARFVRDGGAFTLTRFLGGAWLAVSASLLSLDLFRVLRAVLGLRSQLPLKSERLQKIAGDGAARLGLSRAPRLFLARERCSPFAFGLIRHRVVLPMELARTASDETLRNILAHELVHVRDRDSLWMLFELFCRRILFFHPATFYFAGLYAMTVEKAADEQAVVHGGIDPRDLLKTLLDVAESFSSGGTGPLAVGASRGFREMKMRIEALAQTQKRPRVSGAAFWAFAGLSILTSVGISVAQADVATKGRLEGAREGFMCTQLRHEQIIESWLRIEKEPNQCEK